MSEAVKLAYESLTVVKSVWKSLLMAVVVSVTALKGAISDDLVNSAIGGFLSNYVYVVAAQLGVFVGVLLGTIASLSLEEEKRSRAIEYSLTYYPCPVGFIDLKCAAAALVSCITSIGASLAINFAVLGGLGLVGADVFLTLTAVSVVISAATAYLLTAVAAIADQRTSYAVRMLVMFGISSLAYYLVRVMKPLVNVGAFPLMILVTYVAVALCAAFTLRTGLRHRLVEYLVLRR